MSFGVHEYTVIQFSLSLYICVCVLKGSKRGHSYLILQIEMFFKHLSILIHIFCFLGKTHNLTWVVIVDGLPPAAVMVLSLVGQA